MSKCKKKLLELIGKAQQTNSSLPSDIANSVEAICENIESQKGVYTVLITLGVYKILHPSQDIRYFQENMKGGFSARSVDTNDITPTLKEQDLPSMAESGWLTRSLEQPYPYLKSYAGKIQRVKNEFLEIVDFFQREPTKVEIVLLRILRKAVEIREGNKTQIESIKNPELSIASILCVLEDFLNEKYSLRGGSKIPVIIFYSLYQILISEVGRYRGKNLKSLASHTAPDSKSKSGGDIEVSDAEGLFEALEIKFGVEVSSHIVNRAIEKIQKHNPKRYYILSTEGITQADYDDVIAMVAGLKRDHGCQLIINGLLPTLKYYLRLIYGLDSFINNLSHNIITDRELKIEHKEKWKELFQRLENSTG